MDGTDTDGATFAEALVFSHFKDLEDPRQQGR